MEFATGALSSLLPKLGELLLEEYNLQKGLKKGIRDLRDELLIIEAALVKVSDVPLDQLDPVVKIWANDVRELSYAIEDSLDSFMVRVEGVEPDKTHTFLGFIKNSCKKVTKLKICREIASDIKDVKIQVKEVKERYDRYKDVIGNTIGKTEVDPRLLSMYNKVSDLVGIDEVIDELMEVLSDQRDASENKLKTLSIVGFGGMGKTTLAKGVYDKLNKKFDCAGFVSVGRNPDIKKVLKDILLEFDLQMYNSASMLDEGQLINLLRKFLADKRYLVVIDDIWETPTWELVKCAFVDKDTGSRIITTTRICEVAEKVGGVYSIKPLSDDNSSKLFYTRICGSKGINFVVESAEVSGKILRKCGGVPLSIITVASLLVGKQLEDWSKVYDSIGFGQEDSDVVKNTRKILSFSFYDLPSCLKNCLLHLSMFVEDQLIAKYDLIWIWIAEGFVPCERGIRLFEVGESYFNQLVNRSMIRLVEDPNHSILDACRVHDMVLDLIRKLSSELNFVTIHDVDMEQSTSTPSQSRSIHRLAVHERRAEHSRTSMEMGHVRSFNATWCSDSRLIQLLSFKVLRVLLLDTCKFSESEGFRLEHLGKLVQLRYLGLIASPVAELPRNIGHDLKFLQTLDVRGSGIKELPASLGELSKLMCLRAVEGTRMMSRIGKLTSLEELHLHSVDKCPNFVAELGKLMEVAVLYIRFDEMEKSTWKALVESMLNMHKIQSLSIFSEPGESVNVGSWEDWVPPSNFRELELVSIKLSRRPPWINFSCVPHLSRLLIELEVMEVQDLQILGRLPLLRYLSLLHHNIDCLPYIVGGHEFQNLRYIRVLMEILCGGEGALSMLEELECRATVGMPVGLVPGSMPLIQKVIYYLDCTNCSSEEVEEAEAALRLAAKTHPNSPSLEITRQNYTYGEEGHISKEELDRWAAAIRHMFVELGRTVVMFTIRQSNVSAEYLQDNFSSMFSSVLNNPALPDLLLKLGSQSGLEYSPDIWRRAIKFAAEEGTTDILNEVGSTDSLGDNLSEMMPLVSQVLAELPPCESTLEPQHNDDGKLGGKLHSSLQENCGADTAVTSIEEAAPARLP
ncbi:unnamed protein product [Alopecurus aequalis]